MSCATLRFRAQELDEAERTACSALADRCIDERTREHLRDLYDRIQDERRLAGQRLSLSEHRLSLRFVGPRILDGLAPPALVDRGTAGVLNLARRVASALSGLAYSPRSLSVMDEFYAPMISEPAAGSYRMDVLIALRQPSLPMEGFARPDPDLVVQRTLGILRGICRHDVPGLRGLLPGDYGAAAVRLVRNMLPDGRDLRELEVRDPAQDRETAVALTPDQRDPVRRLLRQLQAVDVVRRRASDSDGRPEGVLRAIDLDERRLRIDLDEGGSVPIQIPDTIGDDEIGMLLNRRVRATGVVSRRGHRLVVADLEPVDAAAREVAA